MRKKYCTMIFLLACLTTAFAVCPVWAAGASGQEVGAAGQTAGVSGQTVDIPAAKQAVKKGWVTRKGKTYYLTKRGKRLKGWHKIRGKRYYFDEKGVLVKNAWIGNRYVGKKGVYNPKKKSLAGLESRLKSAMQSYSGTWSVYVKRLDNGQSLAINNQRMTSASLIKLFAMSAAYERIEQGKLSESSVSGYINNMITVSDNGSFNALVHKIGTTYINSWCRKNGYRYTNQGHGLDPSDNSEGLNNGTGGNITTVRDCGKLLESIYRKTCVSKSASQKMMNYLKRQTYRSKIPAGVPGGVAVANKTGELDEYTHDAAIVFSPKTDYILVVMAYVPVSAWGSAHHITTLSRITYSYFNR